MNNINPISTPPFASAGEASFNAVGVIRPRIRITSPLQQEETPQQPEQQQVQKNINYNQQFSPEDNKQGADYNQMSNIAEMDQQIGMTNPAKQFALGGPIGGDQEDPKNKAYQDSLALYNKGQLDKNKYMQALKQLGINSGELQKITSKETLSYFDGKIKPIAARYANPSGIGSTFSMQTGKRMPYDAYYNADGTDVKIYNPKNKDFIQRGYLEYKKPTGGNTQPTTTNSKVQSTPTKEVVKSRAKLNPLDLKLSSQGFMSTEQHFDLPELYPTARTAKSYKVHEQHGDSTTDYEVQDPSNISMDPNRRQTITPQYAFGGMMNKREDGNNLNHFNVGGTHAENPLGGIPQGMGKNGQMNTVEEGETSFDINGQKFIFSHRIKI